jgi:hypothetical protein
MCLRGIRESYWPRDPFAAKIAKLPELLKRRNPSMRFFQMHHLTGCPVGFSGPLSHAIHCSKSARVANRLASFCPQFSHTLLSSSSVYSSIGGSGSFSSNLSN